MCEGLRYKRTIHRSFNEIQALFVVSFARFLDATRTVHQKSNIYFGFAF